MLLSDKRGDEILPTLWHAIDFAVIDPRRFSP
jgi:hypothetical protein